MRGSLLTLLFVSTLPASVLADPDDVEFFEKQVRPLLVEHCSECHGEKKVEGGLRLLSREAVLKGGDSGAALVPGKPDESLLIRVVEYLGDTKMPPKGKLAAADIDRLRRWVTKGAAWPASPSGGTTTAGTTGFRISPKQQSWWAFRPVTPQTPPAVDAAGALSPIDRFLAVERTALGIAAALPADPRTWIRRVTFDLTGLPPTPDEVEEFLADRREDASERVVDRLLASPLYGQRWGRHWLDIVRYADYHDGDAKARDAGSEPLQAWRYRDWVVDALNRDLPYDQFLVHQIAGDVLPSPDGREFYADGLVATTFLSNGAWDRGDADKEKMVSDMVDDNVDTIGKAFLGLTLGCARCHDHKFDPVSQQDYYALAGIFYSTRILKELGAKGGNYTLNRVPLIEKAYVAKRDEQLKQIKELDAKLTELDKRTPKPAADDPERTALVARRAAVQGELLAEPPLAEAASEGGTPGGLFPGLQDVPVHIRGSYTRLGPVVKRRMPAFFAGESQPSIASGSGRRELAAWVASKENPLTARVLVNRVWQGHFGAGLVRTPNNFGLLSEPPSHPALLDWLAGRFVADGWSLKTLHRRIVLSAAYRQSSRAGADQIEKDPENRWLGRFVPRRLEAEAIRDSMLAVTGRLNASAGGPAGDDVAVTRRSLYVQTARWDRGNFATLFDAANPDASEERRSVSTVAPQALYLLNNAFSLDQARHLAERLAADVPAGAADDATLRIRHAYQLLFQRVPTDEELSIARDLVTLNTPADPMAGWNSLAHVLLCSNEFVYLD